MERSETQQNTTGEGQINAPLTNKGTIALGTLNNNYQQLKTGVLGKKDNDNVLFLKN